MTLPCPGLTGPRNTRRQKPFSRLRSDKKFGTLLFTIDGSAWDAKDALCVFLLPLRNGAAKELSSFEMATTVLAKHSSLVAGMLPRNRNSLFVNWDSRLKMNDLAGLYAREYHLQTRRVFNAQRVFPESRHHHKQQSAPSRRTVADREVPIPEDDKSVLVLVAQTVTAPEVTTACGLLGDFASVTRVDREDDLARKYTHYRVVYAQKESVALAKDFQLFSRRGEIIFRTDWKKAAELQEELFKHYEDDLDTKDRVLLRTRIAIRHLGALKKLKSKVLDVEAPTSEATHGSTVQGGARAEQVSSPSLQASSPARQKLQEKRRGDKTRPRPETDSPEEGAKRGCHEGGDAEDIEVEE